MNSPPIMNHPSSPWDTLFIWGWKEKPLGFPSHFWKINFLVSELSVSQSCPTLCDLIDFTVHRILQARILEWVAFPSPGDLSNSGIEPRSPALQEDSLPAEPQGKPKWFSKPIQKWFLGCSGLGFKNQLSCRYSHCGWFSATVMMLQTPCSEEIHTIGFHKLAWIFSDITELT